MAVIDEDCWLVMRPRQGDSAYRLVIQGYVFDGDAEVLEQLSMGVGESKPMISNVVKF